MMFDKRHVAWLLLGFPVTVVAAALKLLLEPQERPMLVGQLISWVFGFRLWGLALASRGLEIFDAIPALSCFVKSRTEDQCWSFSGRGVPLECEQVVASRGEQRHGFLHEDIWNAGKGDGQQAVVVGQRQ